ncbi:ABC transporter ATP-binding protein [Cesiribacter andamanensis]|uniref:L-cystine import ATP-binding protein TcyN n=1 Tax=Cesiribacter andamanensis AMV16 TaxID=1279009 RepID=M7N1Y2_9BACT|nr:ATP-binding cassette domain-containing protein [Cesiribacter andamanensis]EMR01226.1 L-cystine import ATP-binding protein TcyN [Cesiribacter andamanensis AMV16]
MNSSAEHKAPAAREEVIRIRGLYKSFEERTILSGVDLSLYRGENLVVLGRSGTGKSVLIKCIIRLIQSDAGRIEVLGKNVPELDKDGLTLLRRQVGFSFQMSALYDSMTIRENLEFPLKRNLDIHDPKILNEKVMESLADVGLERTVNQYPAELSGGMKKRIGIARTLILQPEIMLYDEPTAGLDPITSEEINQLMVEVQRKYGTSSIIITHDITCAKTTADRVVFLHEGEVGYNGPFEGLLTTQNPLLSTFMEYYNLKEHERARE